MAYRRPRPGVATCAALPAPGLMTPCEAFADLQRFEAGRTQEVRRDFQDSWQQLRGSNSGRAASKRNHRGSRNEIWSGTSCTDNECSLWNAPERVVHDA